MKWNLNDHLSEANGRYFHLPVASDPLGGTQLPIVNSDKFLIENRVVDITSNFPVLQISVSVPQGGLPDQDGLPDPLIRLHAMCRGKIKYKPTYGSLQRCLLLFIPPIWPRVIQQVKWFERWLEAGCLPSLIIYENVDEAYLRQMLEAIDPNNPVGNQMLFPVEALNSEQNKIDFINRFLAGSDEQTDALTVRPGTIIGKFNQDNSHGTLKLHVRYADHTDTNPHAMLPREFFSLLFGDDSQEAETHPLLQRLKSLGRQDTATLPKTKTMRLRPPLRTYARVMWEINLEREGGMVNDVRWNKSGFLGKDKVVNSVEGFDRENTYEGLYKCNISIFEMMLRSGFRVRMIRTPDASGNISVLYYRVNRLVREAREFSLSQDKPTLLAYRGEKVWGRRWDGVLYKKPQAEQAAEINRMMEEEGRCFYLLREFDGPTDEDISGHSMILERVEESFPPEESTSARPTVAWELRSATERGTKIGLWYIYANVYEAWDPDGLRRRTDVILPAWPEFVSQTDKGKVDYDNDLLLIEAHPGRDPDNQQGIDDLCSIHQKAIKKRSSEGN